MMMMMMMMKLLLFCVITFACTTEGHHEKNVEKRVYTLNHSRDDWCSIEMLL